MPLWNVLFCMFLSTCVVQKVCVCTVVFECAGKNTLHYIISRSQKAWGQFRNGNLATREHDSANIPSASLWPARALAHSKHLWKAELAGISASWRPDLKAIGLLWACDESASHAFRTLRWFGLERIHIPEINLHKDDAIESMSKLFQTFWYSRFESMVMQWEATSSC